MIWIAILITTFLMVGMNRRASPRKRQVLVVAFSSVTMAAMYLTFANG